MTLSKTALASSSYPRSIQIVARMVEVSTRQNPLLINRSKTLVACTSCPPAVDSLASTNSKKLSEKSSLGSNLVAIERACDSRLATTSLSSANDLGSSDSSKVTNRSPPKVSVTSSFKAISSEIESLTLGVASDMRIAKATSSRFFKTEATTRACSSPEFLSKNANIQGILASLGLEEARRKSSWKAV